MALMEETQQLVKNPGGHGLLQGQTHPPVTGTPNRRPGVQEVQCRSLAEHVGPKGSGVSTAANEQNSRPL